jgi:hypothetical protein
LKTSERVGTVELKALSHDDAGVAWADVVRVSAGLGCCESVLEVEGSMIELAGEVKLVSVTLRVVNSLVGNFFAVTFDCEETVGQFDEFSASESGEEILGRPSFDDRAILKTVGVFAFWGFVDKEAFARTDVTIGPAKVVHFAKILDKIDVALELIFDLSEIDDGGSGELIPETLGDGVRDIG